MNLLMALEYALIFRLRQIKLAGDGALEISKSYPLYILVYKIEFSEIRIPSSFLKKNNSL